MSYIFFKREIFVFQSSGIAEKSQLLLTVKLTSDPLSFRW